MAGLRASAAHQPSTSPLTAELCHTHARVMQNAAPTCCMVRPLRRGGSARSFSFSFSLSAPCRAAKQGQAAWKGSKRQLCESPMQPHAGPVQRIRSLTAVTTEVLCPKAAQVRPPWRPPSQRRRQRAQRGPLPQ